MKAMVITRALARWIALAVIAELLVTPSVQARARAPVVAVGATLPDVTIDLGGGPVLLSSLRGKPVVLNIWATWCHPCIDELHVFTRLESSYGDAVQIVTISKDATAGLARRFLDAHGIPLRVADDPDDTIEKRLDLSVVPVTIVLDPQGIVRYVSIGELDWNEMRTAVAPLIAPDAAPGGAG